MEKLILEGYLISVGYKYLIDTNEFDPDVESTDIADFIDNWIWTNVPFIDNITDKKFRITIEEIE